MGILTDFFVASHEQLLAADASKLPSPFPTVRAQGMDPVKLLSLKKLLTGRAGSVGDPVLSVSEDGPWVESVEVDLTIALSELDSKRGTAIAASWAATEEWRMDGVTGPDLTPILLELAALAIQARREDRGGEGAHGLLIPFLAVDSERERALLARVRRAHAEITEDPQRTQRSSYGCRSPACCRVSITPHRCRTNTSPPSRASFRGLPQSVTAP